MTAVVLDSSPLGLLCHKRNPPPATACRAWVDDLLKSGRRVIVPEIADYEIRRELIRIGSKVAINLLDQYGVQLEYLPLTTAVVRKAAELWAQARQAGKPTAPKESLDADVILAAQALSLNVPVIVATDNLGHLSRFVTAEHWMKIIP
jgi:predicted nucleic acid-binding protein